MNNSRLYDEVQVAGMKLKNRIAMAPMTRSRANAEGVPSDLAIQYYSERAKSVGLIFTEGTQPSIVGKGYLNTPGIHSEEQINKWNEITTKVHEQNSKIFLQIMHVGRAFHSSNNPEAPYSLAPSAITTGATIYTSSGMMPVDMPKAMSLDDIDNTMEEFVMASKNAIKAGFDGVMIHGANGYLLDQFLAESTNIREDNYGGSIENRSRFVLDVTKAVADEIGANKVSIRLSPNGKSLGIDHGKNYKDLFRYLIFNLNKLDLALLDIYSFSDDEFINEIRNIWDGTLSLIDFQRDASKLEILADESKADLFPVGTLLLSNPDFTKRLKLKAPFNEVKYQFFFTGENGDNSIGYTDYPELPK